MVFWVYGLRNGEKIYIKINIMTPNEKARDLFVVLLEHTPDYILKDNDDAALICKIHLRVLVGNILKELNDYAEECNYVNIPPKLAERIRWWNYINQEISNI